MPAESQNWVPVRSATMTVTPGLAAVHSCSPTRPALARSISAGMGTTTGPLPRARTAMASGEHFLDRLPGYPHLAGDVGLGETVRGQAAD